MLPLNTALMRSGGLLVDKLKQMSRLNSGTDIRSAEAEYKAQTFFKMGMTDDARRHARQRLEMHRATSTPT